MCFLSYPDNRSKPPQFAAAIYNAFVHMLRGILLLLTCISVVSSILYHSPNARQQKTEHDNGTHDRSRSVLLVWGEYNDEQVEGPLFAA